MKTKLISVLCILVLGVVLAVPVRAQTIILDAQHTSMTKTAAASLNPLQYKSPQQLIGVVIRGAMSFIGSIAIVLYVFAGVIYMTAAGNDEKVKKAALIFVWTTLGVAVMLGSYVIVRFVFGTVLQL